MNALRRACWLAYNATLDMAISGLISSRVDFMGVPRLTPAPSRPFQAHLLGDYGLHPCSCEPFSGQTFCRGPEGGLPARVRNGAQSAEDGVTSLSVLPGGGAAFPPAPGVGSTLGAPALRMLSRSCGRCKEVSTASQLGSSCALRKQSCGNLIWTAARNKEAKA